MKTNKVVVFALLTIISVISFAQTPAAAMGADSVLAIIQSSMAPAVNTLTSQAITWLAVLASLQLFITNYSVLKSGGDIEAAIAKTAGAFVWIGVCIYIIHNGPQFISDVGTQIFGLLGLTLPSPGSIIASTLIVVASLAAVAVGVGGVGILGSTTAGLLIVYILLFILAIGMFFAFKIFMVQLELGLIVMLAPLSFAFLGLNALKDQGIAPFKALISLAYRVILMTLILSAFTKVSDVATTALTGFTGEAMDKGIGEAMNTVLSALGAYLMLAYIFYKSDSIAATLSSGSTSMGPGDVAGAAAAGAAAGAAIATGGASAAGAATKIPQSMSAFMDKLSGGGSLSNASSRGAGGTGTAMAPPPPSSSLSGAAGGAAAPKFETNKAGAPMRPAAAGPVPTSNLGDSMPSKQSSPTAEAPASNGENSPGSSSDTGSADSPVSPASPTSNSSSESASPVFQTNKAGAPIRPAAAPTGSGVSASIGGGSGSTLDETASRLDEFMKQQAAPRKPTAREALGNANHHVAQEKAATNVSINVNAGD